MLCRVPGKKGWKSSKSMRKLSFHKLVSGRVPMFRFLFAGHIVQFRTVDSATDVWFFTFITIVTQIRPMQLSKGRRHFTYLGLNQVIRIFPRLGKGLLKKLGPRLVTRSRGYSLRFKLAQHICREATACCDGIKPSRTFALEIFSV